MPSSSEIRQQFIDYFVARCGHTFVPSSPVVPHGDPTLLFANAGMNQFKDVFLGTGTRQYRRAVNTQKCIRAGGKHNDLEDVGHDTYHHTFFEMLGNWSFGDYFKKEAIQWAWDLLTNVWGLDKTRLHVTVFGGDPSEGLEADEEAANLWKTLTDINPAHIHRGSKKDNFWEMGDTGPCGPCSEVHVDLTPDRSGKALVNKGDARVIEIWNLVFIQFNRDSTGRLSPLPAKHVDTGMGFERLCAVLQGKSSNYDTDVFAPIFKAIQGVTGAAPYSGRLDSTPQGKADTAYRVIADHVRCLTFALTDGAVPSNEGRGYVLRRILRRAVRHGWQTLGVKEPFLHRLVPVVVETMGGVFPELKKAPQQVIDLIREEEESFEKTLDRGINLFNEAAITASYGFIQQHKQDNVIRQFVLKQHGSAPDPSAKYDWVFFSGDQNKVLEIDWRQLDSPLRPQIDSEDAFKLHDTYGFPLDLTQVMAQERGMTVDVTGFDRLMEQAREQSRGVGKQGAADQVLVDYLQKNRLTATQFVGYEQMQVEEAKVVAAGYFDGQGGVVADVNDPPAHDGFLVVTRTPFYAESGGQVGDRGAARNSRGVQFNVVDTIRVGDVIFHLGRFTGRAFEKGELVSLQVDQARRRKIMANHTGTHLMNRAMRQVLGDHVQQKGSLVDDQKLRFDFSHTAAMSDPEVGRIEQLVNADVAAGLPVYAEESPQDQALKINGLRAVFGEKYPPRVRVVSIGVPVGDLLARPDDLKWCDYSVEFCGGTHLSQTGDVGGFVVVDEQAVAKGVRRVTALTGAAAGQAAADADAMLARLEALRKAPTERLAGEIAQLTEQINTKLLPILVKSKLRDGLAEMQKLAKEHQKQQSREAAGAVVEVARKLAEEPAGQVMVASLDDADATARTAMDVIRKKKPETALLLGSVCGDKVSFVAAVPQPLIDRGLKAGDWVREVAKIAGGSGGGRPDMAQAGGKDPLKLREALDAGRAFAAAKL